MDDVLARKGLETKARMFVIDFEMEYGCKPDINKTIDMLEIRRAWPYMAPNVTCDEWIRAVKANL